MTYTKKKKAYRLLNLIEARINWTCTIRDYLLEPEEGVSLSDVLSLTIGHFEDLKCGE